MLHGTICCCQQHQARDESPAADHFKVELRIQKLEAADTCKSEEHNNEMFTGVIERIQKLETAESDNLISEMLTG